MIRDNGEYIDDESSVIYVLDNCSSEVLKHLDSECIFEVGIGEDECDCAKCACKNGEKPTTTSSAKSVYKVNGKECSKEEFDKKYEEFEEMYLDNIRDMLLGYCEFMDEVNEWRSRFLRW